MNVQAPPEGSELLASFVAVRLFAIYSQMGLFFAAVEAGAIKPECVFKFNRLNADIFRQLATSGKSGPVAAKAHAAVAEMLEEFERTVRNMATIPPGAGRA